MEARSCQDRGLPATPGLTSRCLLRHAAGHEAANVDHHMVRPATIDRPHHGAACPVRLGNDRLVWHVPPLIFDPNAVVTVPRYPVGIGEGRPVGIGAARALAALEAIEPWLEGRVSIASVITCECGRGD